ncbi:MAG TPA: hypothetical protein DCM27_07905 [Rhodospirillaceae bacterium]|nr:hypothetical protein [Rhodospirillaceae bacterium]
MPEDNTDNIITFQPRPQKDDRQNTRRPPPMFNIPPATKLLTGLLIAIHLVIFALTNSIEPQALDIAVYFAGFIPAHWTGMEPFYWWTPFSLIGFSLLHGGWMHLAFNVVMLVAMGSGLEKSVGIKQYLMIYVGTTLFAAFAHLALYPSSTMPIIGASGGISGIFGAMLVVMNQTRSSLDKNTLMPVIIAYIGISVLVGLMGAPDGSSVAWIAHIGGFLAGIGFMMTLLKRRK